MPQIATQIEKQYQDAGLSPPKDVRILLNSHAHFDHSGGLAKLKADTGATLMASAGDRYALEKGVYPGSENVTAFDFPPVKVDRAVKDGDTLSLGGVTLTANITPGHTRGCTSWTMPVVDARPATTAFFFCSATVAANRLAPNPQYPGIIDDYRGTFALLKTMNADIYLAPHSEFFDMAGKRAKLEARKAQSVREAGRAAARRRSVRDRLRRQPCQAGGRQAMTRQERIAALKTAARERILIFDGSWGVMIQKRKLDEADYRGDRFKDHPGQLKGNNDLLCLTRPDIIADLHDQYFAAGADISETNTFSSTWIAQADYEMGPAVRDMNLAGAARHR